MQHRREAQHHLVTLHNPTQKLSILRLQSPSISTNNNVAFPSVLSRIPPFLPPA